MIRTKREFRLILTDGKGMTIPLGTFVDVGIDGATKQARKRFAGMFNRLKLNDWVIREAEEGGRHV